MIVPACSVVCGDVKTESISTTDHHKIHEYLNGAPSNTITAFLSVSLFFSIDKTYFCSLFFCLFV